MGYQDRDYFREEHRPYLDLIRSTRMCWAIVIVISVVFLAALFTQETAQPLEDYLRLNPQAMVKDWQWYRLLTAVFVAEKPWHMAFALLVIWLIGHELEHMVGGLEMLAFFIVCTLLSNFGLTLVYYLAQPAMKFGGPLVSSFGPAAGAMAMLAWAVVVSPHRTVTYLFVPMPMWVTGALILVFDLFFFMQQEPLLVKLSVHALSLPFAVAYSFYAWRLTGWPRWQRMGRRQAQRQLTPVLQAPTRHTYVREKHDSPTATARVVDEQLEAKLDLVLEKVSTSGMQSLTDEEKQILQKASEAMRKRKGE